MDDGDDRVRQLFRLEGRAATPPRLRLAWKPWARGLVLGVLFGALIATVVWLIVLRGIEESLRPAWSKPVKH